MSEQTERAATKVLVADDETPIRLLVRVNLEAEGFDVIEAADGRQTLEIARAEVDSHEQPDRRFVPRFRTSSCST